MLAIILLALCWGILVYILVYKSEKVLVSKLVNVNNRTSEHLSDQATTVFKVFTRHHSFVSFMLMTHYRQWFFMPSFGRYLSKSNFFFGKLKAFIFLRSSIVPNFSEDECVQIYFSENEFRFTLFCVKLHFMSRTT